jgi:hypothetical protein
MKEARSRIAILCESVYMICLENAVLIETQNRLSVAWVSGWEQSVTIKRHEGSYYNNGIVLILDCGDDYVTGNLL